MMLRNSFRVAAIAVIAMATAMTAACGGTGTSGSSGETVTVYSADGLATWYKSQFDKFTKDTGIAVNLVEAGSGEVVSRVEKEQSNPQADLLVTLPPFIQKADKSGLLVASGVDTKGIPADQVGPGGNYLPIVNNALSFIANPSANPQPKTWDDLLAPQYKGKLQYSTPGQAGDGTAVLVLLQHLLGKPGALDYLTKLQANNVGPSSSTGKLQPKVNNGELLVANGDVQMNLGSIKDDGSKFTIFIPASADGKRTTVSLPYVAGITKGAPHEASAKKLLDYLLAFTFLYGTAGAVNAAISSITGNASPVLNFLYTPAGVIAAEITFFTSFVVRPLLASFALLPRAQLDVAASLGGSPLRVLRSVVMPEAWPALMAGGSLVLLLTLNEFGIVLFTGAKGVITWPVLIYTRGIVTFDLTGAAVIATVQVALSLALYGLYRMIFARVMTGRGKGAADVVVEPAK